MTVTVFERESFPAELADLVGPEIQGRWASVDRSFHQPRLVSAREGGRLTAAALVTARPGTSYLKIVDAVGQEAALGGLLDEIVAEAEAVGAAQLKWEGWTLDETQAAGFGFAPLLQPLPSGDGTENPPRGYLRWLAPERVRETPFYRQTTDFTCGAVAALAARVNLGYDTAADFDRARELSLWRQATNFPACEPYGLAVALKKAWPDSAVSVALDTARPVVLDFHPEPDREWRAVLQQLSREEASTLGISVDHARLSMTELAAHLAEGRRVLLLISLTRMNNDPSPHWVVAEGLAGGSSLGLAGRSDEGSAGGLVEGSAEGLGGDSSGGLAGDSVEGSTGVSAGQVIVISDPWVETSLGDSWVDAHLLPIPPDELDTMSSMEHDGYRGALIVA